MATQPLNSTPEVHHLMRKPVEDVEVIAPPQLALQRAPEVVLEEAAKAATALRNLIESKPNKCVINGKTFLQFEDWQTVARFYGITVAARSTNFIQRGRVQGYECHAEAILAATGQVIGAAQAECLDDEKKWRDSPMFQLRSMAQTRAQAKALRSVLAWVVVLAGYQPTPAEEMDGVRSSQPSNLQYTPMHPDRVRKLCFEIANSATIEECRGRYLSAQAEARKNQDRAALDAFVAAKDARKKELNG